MQRTRDELQETRLLDWTLSFYLWCGKLPNLFSVWKVTESLLTQGWQEDAGIQRMRSRCSADVREVELEVGVESQHSTLTTIRSVYFAESLSTRLFVVSLLPLTGAWYLCHAYISTCYPAKTALWLNLFQVHIYTTLCTFKQDQCFCICNMVSAWFGHLCLLI